MDCNHNMIISHNLAFRLTIQPKRIIKVLIDYYYKKRLRLYWIDLIH